MGFFDKKSSSSTSTSAAQTTQSLDGGSTALGLGNISLGGGKYAQNHLNLNFVQTDFGAVEGALDFADNAQRTALSFADDAFNNAAALAADAQRTALSFASDAFTDAAALTGRALDKQTTANLEYLGQVSSFAELSAKTAKENAELSERQANAAISAVANANKSALDMTNRLAQDTQTATLKALDYVFEASQSETARLADTSLKWILGAMVAIFVLPALAKGK